MVMETIVGNPNWCGLSLPREPNRSLLGNQWWCMLALLVFVHHHHGGMRSVVWCLVVSINPRYAYDGRHNINAIEEPISAVVLVMEMRIEREERRKSAPPIAVFPAQSRHVTRLNDRPWTWGEEGAFA
jgi:hypothetical protein